MGSALELACPRSPLVALPSRVSNMVVNVTDAEHAESSDRTFSYNAGDGRLMMILANKMKWTLVEGKWLISYVNFEPIWVSSAL